MKSNCEGLQTQYNWDPISEHKKQFTMKYPLKSESASLINSTQHINYIKPSQLKLRKELIKPIRIERKRFDLRPVYVPASAYKFGLSCSKNVERPDNVIYTDDCGYSRHVDPYLSTTTKDYLPQKHSLVDNVTFWNWNASDINCIASIKNKRTSRAMVPPAKKSLRKSFTSEVMSKFLQPSKSELHVPKIKSIVLEPTDRMERFTEYSCYGSNVNCMMLLKQRK